MSELQFDKEDDDGQLVDLNQVEANLTAAIEHAGESVSSTSYSESSTGGSRFVRNNTSSQDEGIVVGSLNSKVSQGMSVFLTVLADRNQQSFPDQMGAKAKSRFTDLVEPGYFEKRKRAVKGDEDGPRDKASVVARGGHHDFLLGSSRIAEKSLTEFGPKGVKLDAKTVIQMGIVPKEYANSLNNVREAKKTPSALRLKDGLAKGDASAEDYARSNPTNLNVQAALH